MVLKQHTIFNWFNWRLNDFQDLKVRGKWKWITGPKEIYGAFACYIQIRHNGHCRVPVFTFHVVGFGHDPVMVIFGNFVNKVWKWSMELTTFAHIPTKPFDISGRAATAFVSEWHRVTAWYFLKETEKLNNWLTYW